MSYRIVESLSIGPFHLRTWGLFVGLGFLVGSVLAAHLARRRGESSERMWTLAIVLIASAVIGSRVLWALQPANLAATLGHPLRLVSIWESGLTLIGGGLAAAFAGVVYVRRTGLPLWRTADVVAPAFGLGLAVGRLGCFLTGLHPGRTTWLPWGIEYLGAVRHPIPLYESLLGLLLLGLGLALLRLDLRPGIAGLTVALSYLVGRSGLDLLRAEDLSGSDPRLLGGLTLTQAVALLAVPALLYLALRVARARRRQEPTGLPAGKDSEVSRPLATPSKDTLPQPGV